MISSGEKQKRKVQPAVIVVLALACAVLFTINRSFGTRTVNHALLLAKKQVAISVRPIINKKKDIRYPKKLMDAYTREYRAFYSMSQQAIQELLKGGNQKKEISNVNRSMNH